LNRQPIHCAATPATATPATRSRIEFSKQSVPFLGPFHRAGAHSIAWRPISSDRHTRSRRRRVLISPAVGL
jgi:hypothetical protein